VYEYVYEYARWGVCPIESRFFSRICTRRDRERDAILSDRMILVKCVPGETLPENLTRVAP
jgi:hypothetical protein